MSINFKIYKAFILWLFLISWLHYILSLIIIMTVCFQSFFCSPIFFPLGLFCYCYFYLFYSLSFSLEIFLKYLVILIWMWEEKSTGLCLQMQGFSCHAVKWVYNFPVNNGLQNVSSVWVSFWSFLVIFNILGSQGSAEKEFVSDGTLQIFVQLISSTLSHIYNLTVQFIQIIDFPYSI